MLGQMFTFREVESGDEVIVPNVKGERAGDGDVDGTTSSSSIDSMRVNEALLAVGSQHMCQCQRSGHRDSPVSSV